MKWKRFILLGVLVVWALSAAGCDGGGNQDQNAGQGSGAAAAIEAYLREKVERGDETALVNLACAAWEAQAVAEAGSFRTIDAEITEMQCTEAGADGDYTVVECEGKIKAIYGVGDQRELSLGGPYRAIQEGGAWKMCGLAE
ncbi:MAG: hypothetical protein JXB47_08270 [Anaerolineae bacterium]|nr:hypothetical protein [Anaerolineae bacterium]